MSATSRSSRPVEPGLEPTRDTHGLGAADRCEVAGIQRARMIAAAMHVIGENGAVNFTVASVVERAGVSRRTFYELFSDSEDCLLATVSAAVEETRARMLALPDAVRGGWREETRARLAALLAFFDEHPALARLLVVEWLAAGPRALDLRRDLIGRLAAAIEEHARTPGNSQPPTLTGEAVVGSVASVLHARLLAPHGPPLVELTSQLMSLIVLPYLGQAAARRELDRPIPLVSAEQEDDKANGEAGELGIRVTYRTVRVLRAIAARPGASNRQIAQAAGVADQGQISKLLKRLEKAGLVQNRGAGQFRGAPNSWMLTHKGERVERSIARGSAWR